MTLASGGQATIIRTERGLTISGTRITLYDVMDYLKAQYPSKLIREKLGLNDEQIRLALEYIDTHRAEVEAEYQECLQTAAEIRQYWEERNRALSSLKMMAHQSRLENALRVRLSLCRNSFFIF